MVLVKEERLRAGLQDWDNRNQLMRELNLTGSEDKQPAAKWCLAFLLGEKSAYHKFSGVPLLNEYMKRVQYFIISLDRLIDNLSVQAFDGEDNETTLRRLKDIRFSVLNHYNHDSLMDYETAFSEILYIIQAGLADLGTHANTKKMISTLLESIDLTAVSYLTRTPLNLEEEKKAYPSYPALIQTGSVMQRIGMDVIMGSNNKHWYLDPTIKPDKTYDFQTHYLQSADGTTVDGLWVKKKGEKKKTVVLALIGHFQTENQYLSSSFGNYYDLFNTDIIFINPRNYSQHAGIKAISIEDIVSDVIAFADFASHKYKHIILYGMCGGVPFMTLAAKRLEDEGRDFKLIVDRFSDSYSTIFNKKTLRRGFDLMTSGDTLNLKRNLEKYNKVIQYIPDFSFNLFLNMYLYALSITRQSVIIYLGLNFSLADILMTIAMEKILILQAKSHKISGESVPEYTDLIIHPDHDMRHAFKERRHQQRVVLKKLAAVSLDIAVSIPRDSKVHKHLMSLFKIFTTCLHTIDNEKLKGDDGLRVVTGTDLHAYKLFELKTRNNQPINKFIQAFCLFKSGMSVKMLFNLQKIEAERLNHRLDVNLPDFDVTPELARKVKDIFDTVYDNRAFIVPLAERVSASGRYDLNATLKALDTMLKEPEPNPEKVAAMQS